jgi:D-beta-D-heptose 7-phosphate kinase/D-beta-D-heptose 1-phosphate adenosyltransferase
MKLSELKKIRARGKRAGRKMVFTNGCFDLIHVGHVRYLQKAKALGDFLVVGLNSDGSVRRLKGAGRPLLPEKERAEILCAFWFVDFVVIFKEDTPERLIRELQPEVLVKGADWTVENIVGADLVLKNGGEVHRIEFVPGRSTSRIITQVLRRRRTGAGKKSPA